MNFIYVTFYQMWAANFFLKSSNPKSANSQAYFIPRSQISQMCQSANRNFFPSQSTSRKFLQNTAQICPSFKNVFFICKIFVNIKSMYLRTCRGYTSARNANPQITNPSNTKKIAFANRKYAKCHICGRSNKLFEPVNLRIFDLRNLFADCLPLPFTRCILVYILPQCVCRGIFS